MNKLGAKIMNARFGKLLKLWIAAALCVALLGGGISAVLLRPQISEAATAVQTLFERRDKWEQELHDTHEEDDRLERRHENRFEIEEFPIISRPSNAALFSVGITGLLTGLLGIAFWLGMAAWLYQAAVRSGMKGLLWGLLGLLGSIFTAVVFLIVRSFIREKCPACGRWQEKDNLFCHNCGEKMQNVCPSCGARSGIGAAYCPSCGERMDAGTQETV